LNCRPAQDVFISLQFRQVAYGTLGWYNPYLNHNRWGDEESPSDVFLWLNGCCTYSRVSLFQRKANSIFFDGPDPLVSHRSLRGRSERDVMKEENAMNENEEPVAQADSPPAARKSPLLKALLNLAIVGMLVAVGYLSYAYIARGSGAPAVVAGKAERLPAKVIQLDVLNGCGVKGVGAKFTGFLRGSGFDVVEMKNYKTFNIAQTLVVDRVGDLGPARRVAAALGVAEKYVVQQINPDYFVDVSVIIGEDYRTLHPSH